MVWNFNKNFVYLYKFNLYIYENKSHKRRIKILWYL